MYELYIVTQMLVLGFRTLVNVLGIFYIIILDLS